MRRRTIARVLAMPLERAFVSPSRSVTMICGELLQLPGAERSAGDVSDDLEHLPVAMREGWAQVWPGSRGACKLWQA